MPPRKVKASMACKLENVKAFLEKQEEFKADCQELARIHTNSNPDVEWQPEHGPGRKANMRREKARMKLVLELEFDEETGRPRFPPPNTRLSDEWVYLAIKHMKCILRGQRYPYDFDKRGDIDPDRVPSGPAPIIWAHGLPFFPVYKGHYVLCGRAHAECIGWLIEEKNREVMKRSPHFSIGAVIAPNSAVDSEHTIDRQLLLHQPLGNERDLRFKGKYPTRDVVSANHHDCAVLPRLNHAPLAMPLWKVRGYNARCGPRQPGCCPTCMRKEFFMEHGLTTDEEYDHLTRTYHNIYSDEEEDSEDETTSGEDTSAEEENNMFIAQNIDSQDSEMSGMAPVPEVAEAEDTAHASLQDKTHSQDSPQATDVVQLLPQSQAPYNLASYDPVMVNEYGSETDVQDDAISQEDQVNSESSESGSNSQASQLLPANQFPSGLTPDDPLTVDEDGPQRDTQYDDLFKGGFEFADARVHPGRLNTKIDMSDTVITSSPVTPEEWLRPNIMAELANGDIMETWNLGTTFTDVGIENQSDSQGI